MPVIHQEGVAVCAMPGRQCNHTLPCQDHTALINIPAADEQAAKEEIAQLEAQRPATQPGSGTSGHDSDADLDFECEPNAEDKATRKMNHAARNKRNRKLAGQNKAEATKAALPKHYCAGAPRTLAELKKYMSRNADENGNTSLGLGVG